MVEVNYIFGYYDLRKGAFKQEGSEYSSFSIRSLQARPSKTKRAALRSPGALLQKESFLTLLCHYFSSHAPSTGASVNRLLSPSLRDVLNVCREGFFLDFSLIAPEPISRGYRGRGVPDPYR